jgi:CRP/FNR family transcriptional regulator
MSCDYLCGCKENESMGIGFDSDCESCDANKFCYPEGGKLASFEHIDIRYSKGDMIFKQGTIAPHVMLLKEGLVKIFLEHDNQRQTICLEKDGFIGLESMYGDQHFQYSVMALTDVKVCLIEIKEFQKQVLANGKLGAGLITDLNKRSHYLYQRIIALTRKQAHGRIADIILCLAGRIFESDQFVIPCKQKELADMAAISPESLSRILKDFKEDGVVTISGKNVSVLDRAKLEMISKVS